MIDDGPDLRTALQIAKILGLEPLPDEGGLYRQTFADGVSTAIYFLLVGDDFSALHKLTGPETYHFYSGSPLRLLLIDDATGEVREPVLGLDLSGGERPQLTVPGGVWQGSSSAGAWTLIGTTMAPPFSSDDFALGDRAELTRRFPAGAARIAELSRT
ncbi:MAG: cupin domain-containing protein [Nakamurella sp.]